MPTYDIRPSVATLQVTHLESNSNVTFEKTFRGRVIYYLCTDLSGDEFDYSIGDMYPEGKVVYEIASKAAGRNENVMKSYSQQMLIFARDTAAYLYRKRQTGNRMRKRWEQVPGVVYPSISMDMSPRWVVVEPAKSMYISLQDVHKQLGGTQQEHRRALCKYDPDYLEWFNPKTKREVPYFNIERIRPYMDKKLKRRPVSKYNRDEWYDAEEACARFNNASRSSLTRFVERHGISTIRARSKNARIMVLYNKQELDNKINEHNKTHRDNTGKERVTETTM